MIGLVEFLRARLDEDAHVARRAGGKHTCWTYDREKFTVTAVDSNWSIFARRSGGRPICDVDGEHVARWDPARVLAEVETKRRILEQLGNGDGCFHSREVLRLLASLYADHPDYDLAVTTDASTG